MTDYQGNSKKDKDKPKKEIVRVTTGEVLVPKDSVGKKFKDVFIANSLRVVATAMLTEVVVPYLKNMILDAGSRGLEKMMYPNGRGGSPRPFAGGGGQTQLTMYDKISRGFRQPQQDTRNLPMSMGNQGMYATQRRNTEFILATRAEAEAVLEQMIEVIDHYKCVSVGDLYGTIGLQGTHVDEKWGWVDLTDAHIRETRDGYSIDFPQPIPLS